MSEIISRELLSEVLCIPLDEIDKFKKVYNGVQICWTEKEAEKYMCPYHVDTYNIHELAHKCKEWAWNNKILLVVSPQGNSFKDIPFYKVRILDNGEEVKVFTDLKLYEPEAIFKACQYILEKKDK